MQRHMSEFLGTFALVFAGTGAIVINHVSQGVIGHAGIALTFGLIVLAMIYTFGDVSGAHLNPAESHRSYAVFSLKKNKEPDYEKRPSAQNQNATAGINFGR